MLCDDGVGTWLWDVLRAAFPLALACCLMPNHPHLVTPLEDPDAGRQRLNRVFGKLARRLGVPRTGEATPPALIADQPKLRRQLRYVALNPSRERLAQDPLAWLYSTHRDVVGAVIDPWVDGGRLARVLREPANGFVERWHTYVSSDPSVRVDGTPFPRPATPTALPSRTLAAIALAAATATRSHASAIQRRSLTRRVFVQLAYDQGWRSSSQLADVCNCSPRAIIDLRVPAPDLLEPARLCLGDLRRLCGRR